MQSTPDPMPDLAITLPNQRIPLCIVIHRWLRTKTLYLVEWSGLLPEAASWQDEEAFSHHKRLLNAYKRREGLGQGS